MPPNHDPKTVRDFGREWGTFDQSALPAAEARELFERYFRIFPCDALPKDAVGFDLGCGSGRWARFVADRVGALYCLDASAEAAGVARRNLRSHPNCHVVRALRPGGTLLVYLYYALDDRPAWFRLLWRITDLGRRAISRLPLGPRRGASTAIAPARARLRRRCASMPLHQGTQPQAVARAGGLPSSSTLRSNARPDRDATTKAATPTRRNAAAPSRTMGEPVANAIPTDATVAP